MVIIDGKIYKITKKYDNGDLRLKLLDVPEGVMVNENNIVEALKTPEQAAWDAEFDRIFNEVQEQLASKARDNCPEDAMWIKEPHQK